MPNKPVLFFNRYTNQIETEKIYGESSIRWIYNTPLGNLTLNALLKRACFSKLYGLLMSAPLSKRKVIPFIEKYHVDPSGFQKQPNQFTSFNDFFYRKLKPSARPIDPNPLHAVFPADGRHLGFQDISKISGVFVKNQSFDIPTLLGSLDLTQKFKNGTLILSRLCPTDYHRFHFPIQGTPKSPSLINGFLNSVNPIALRKNINILFQNKRVITSIHSDIFGHVLMIEVGATCVGSIIQTFSPNSLISKGTEKGFFKFGGSSTILLFQQNKIKLADDLVHHSNNNMELYAKVGDFLGAPF